MKNGPGPVLMIRADMDALPVHEQPGLAYASTARALTPDGLETPVMHACGHDIHMPAWIGTARRLRSEKCRLGNDCVSTYRTRLPRSQYKKNKKDKPIHHT